MAQDSVNQEKGNISIHTENILPIIKKWLYSDREIFIRELISNGVDADSKLKKLSLTGEFDGEYGDLYVDVTVDKEKKTITFSDNGIGMSADEVKKYINQIAFSGAEDFVEKFKNEDNSDAIIGHFGLGFYSAFMVSEKVEIFTKSYRSEEKACHWVNEGGTEFVLEECDKKERGTDIVLHIDSDSSEFLEVATVRGIIEKYCNFLPFSIKINGSEVNDKSPLWLKPARETKDEEYKEFYNKLFPMEGEPLFWVHLDVEVPFRLKGILYFPRLKHELDSSKGRIKLFCNQVFVTDNAKEIFPEYLTLLQGAVDAPDLPLNVSRSYLQNDVQVKKISEHITKKISDKLHSIFKKDREKYDKYWEDINLFVKFALMNDEKFYDRMKDIILYKTTDGTYRTLEEFKEKNKGINPEENGKQVVLYASDEEKQITFIDMIKKQDMEAVIFNTAIDVHFIQFIEMKDGTVQFMRIDSDNNKSLQDENNESKIVDENNKTENDHIKEVFENILKKDNDKIEVKVQNLKNASTPSMIVFSEQMRRFKEMSMMFQRGGGEDDIFGMHSLMVNPSNDIVKKAVELSKTDSDRASLLVHHIYDIALLSQNNLTGDRLVSFINRSQDIMSKL